MQTTGKGRTKLVLGSVMALTLPLFSTAAFAHARNHDHRHGLHTAAAATHGGRHYRTTRLARGISAPVIQCVAFARQDSGIALSGNARDWWENAAGVYARGAKPETGSVLSFRANGRMRLGHVAVVSDIVDSRTIVIDQSHWGSRGITRDMTVVDVSEKNDWTAVRVQLGHGSSFGSIYPTHGFIYPRPDAGTLVANVEQAPVPALNPAPRDLRANAEHNRAPVEEVAEAPANAAAGEVIEALATDAPDRDLR